MLRPATCPLLYQESNLKMKLIVLTVLAAGTIFAAELSVGVRIGAPPPVRVVRVQPRSPGAGYSWVSGYWYPVGGHYKWHDGYWTRPVYTGAHWVGPHHDGERYYAGYWDGERGQVAHDHQWDRNHANRDH